jgi:outer membrane PBP1 activator LpoA protein
MKLSDKFDNRALVALFLLVSLALAGCEGMNDQGSVAATPAKTQSQSDHSSAQQAQAAPAQNVSSPEPMQAAASPVGAEQTAQTASVQSNEQDPELESKRLQTQNLIYARIRIKMEELIAERAKLLKSGTDPTDPQVRQIEGQIMRARDLLQENGEVVEEVEPPIVNRAEK